jgi:hypothetical protein
MTFHLVCCTQTICAEVQQGFTQKEIAVSYALAIRSAAVGADSPDWSAINGAILSRWKMSGLERIKKLAIDMCRRAENTECS